MSFNLSTYYTLSIPEMVQRMGTSNFTIGSTHLVHITHINSPQSFYVRISKLRYAVKLLEIRGPPMTISELAIGKIVVYKSPCLRRFVRGRVQKMDMCTEGAGLVSTMLAIDYGCVDVHLPVTDIYFPDAASLACGPLALHCQLKNCEPIGETFDRESINAMNFYVGKYTSKITIEFKTTEKFSVELRSFECRKDVSSMLAHLQFTSVYPVHDGAFSIKQPRYAYNHRDLKVGKKLKIRVQSGSTVNSFYGAEVEEYKKYDNVIEWYKFSKYCIEQPPVDVVRAAMSGRACGVKVLNPVKYERAVVLKITVPNAKALVQLIDWGKDIEANFEDIKPVGDEFTKKPALAFLCTADKLSCLTYGSGVRMVYPALEFVIEVVSTGVGFRVPHRVIMYPTTPLRLKVPFSDGDNDDNYD